MTLELRDVHAGYGKSRVLHGVDLSVERGTIVTLIGRNGVGRSTTLKAIVAMVETDRGSILLDGREQRGRRTFEIVRAGIAYVPEERLIFDNLTVEENLVLGMQGARAECAAWSVSDMYAFFPSLLERRNALAGRLSGGEQQMLTICRTLMGDPHLIMVDEPTEGLAPMLVTQVAEMLTRIAERGVSILLVEQKLTIALTISRRVYVMGHGRVVFEGAPDDLRRAENVRKEWLEV